MPQAAVAIAPSRMSPGPSSSRAKLRQAINALKAAEGRIETLEQARDRAAAQIREMYDSLKEAEAALANSKLNERQYRVNAFVNGEETAPPTLEAERKLAQAQGALQGLNDTQAILIEEIEKLNGQLRHRNTAVHEALSDVIVGSSEFAHLFNEYQAAWGRLRGLIRAFVTVQRELHGYMPDRFMNMDHRSVPLDPERNGPFPAPDPEPSAAWAESLARLAEDADADLPNDI